MIRPVGTEAYREQLSALLPPGRAWTRDPGSVLQRLLAAIAGVFARLDVAAANLLVDALPSTAFWLLPDWERTLGLRDACSDLAPTIPERRAAVVGKLVTVVGANSAEFVRFRGGSTASLVRVTTLDRTRADAISGLDTSAGKWRFVWWISIPTDARIRYFDTLSDVNTPLRAWDGVPGHAELECRLQQLAPAHTLLVFEYHNSPRRLTWLGRPLTRGSDGSWSGREERAPWFDAVVSQQPTPGPPGRDRHRRLLPGRAVQRGSDVAHLGGHHPRASGGPRRGLLRLLAAGERIPGGIPHRPPRLLVDDDRRVRRARTPRTGCCARPSPTATTRCAWAGRCGATPTTTSGS